MRSTSSLCATLLTLPSFGFGGAPDEALSHASTREAAKVAQLCGVGTEAQANSPKPGSCVLDPALLGAIAAWISADLDLPEVRDLPQVEFAPPEVLAAIHLGGLRPDPTSASALGHGTSTSRAHDITALYDDASETIYLRHDWSAGTPADLSILVHEMVHHVQNQAGLIHECAAAREKQAFAAQARWLSLFGKTLDGEFSIDPMTLFLRTTCPR